VILNNNNNNLDEASLEGQPKSASNKVDSRRFKLDASLYNTFLTLKLALILIEFINISSL
jgi:hypothetical protein